jgi:hypothetical protein
MVRAHMRKTLQGPSRYTSQDEEAHRPPHAVQSKATGPVGSMDCVNRDRTSTVKVVILTGSATLVAVLLMAFTVYAGGPPGGLHPRRIGNGAH